MIETPDQAVRFLCKLAITSRAFKTQLIACANVIRSLRDERAKLMKHNALLIEKVYPIPSEKPVPHPNEAPPWEV